MEVIDHKCYDQWKLNRESSTSGIFFKNQVLLEVRYFARNIYKTETVTLGYCYIEDLTFLENIIVWFWNSLDVQSIDSSVEFVQFYIRGSFFKKLSAPIFGKECTIQKKL